MLPVSKILMILVSIYKLAPPDREEDFIPGTSANAVNFQAYLIEGLARWNTLRKEQVDGSPMISLRSFDVELVTKSLQSLQMFNQ